jgi:hypothetical protein
LLTCAEPFSTSAVSRIVGRSSRSASSIAWSAHSSASAGDVAQHERLRDGGHRRGLLVLVGQFPDRLDHVVGEQDHVFAAAGLPRDAREQALGAGPLAWRGGDAQRLLRVPVGVVEQAGEPGRPGGDHQQLQVLRHLAQAHLRELQRLEGRAHRQVLLHAAAHRVDHVVVAAGALGVVRDQGQVGALVGAEVLEGQFVQAPALAAEQLVGDRLAGQRVPEAEQVVAHLHEQVAADEFAQHLDQVVFGQPGDDGEQVEGHLAAQHGRRPRSPAPGCGRARRAGGAARRPGSTAAGPC